MLNALKRRKNRAFTLLELIVVIVILGLLATISVPTFKNIIDKTKLNTDIASMQALTRAEIATAALNLNVYDEETVKTVISETASKGKVWTTASVSTKFGEIAYKITPTNDNLTVTTRTSTGNECINVTTVGSSYEVNITDLVDNTCPVVENEPEPEEPGSGNEQAPSNVNAAFADNAINVTWEGSSKTYTLERKSSTSSWVNVTEKTEALNFVDTNLTKGETYSYRVVGLNEQDVKTTYSNESNPITLSPAAPVLTKVIIENGTTAVISWTKALGATSYELYNDGALIETPIGDVSTITHTLTAGQSAVFTLKALNASGVSEMSNNVSVTATPNAPSNVNTRKINEVNAAETTQLYWDETPGALSYNVYVNNIFRQSVPAPLTSFDVILKPSEVATLSVSAVNISGQSAQTSAPVVTGAGVTSLNAAAGVNGVRNITWAALPGATKYRVSVTNAATGSVNKVDVGTATSWNLPANVTRNADVTVTIFAENVSGASTNGTSLVVKTPPAAPTNLVYSANTTNANLRWTAAPGATSYIVTNTVTSAKLTPTTAIVGIPAAWGSNATNVRAVNAGGESAAVNAPTMPVYTTPTKPTVTIVKGGIDEPGKTYLNWNADANVGEYSVTTVIERKSGTTWSVQSTNTIFTTGLTHNVSTLSNSIRATVTIVAKNAKGNSPEAKWLIEGTKATQIS